MVDAFVHTLEQYLTYPVDAKVQDRFAEGLLLTLLEDGSRALAEPENYGVRANVMWSATMALNGLIGAGVPQDWATHMLGHELTAMHDPTTRKRWPSSCRRCCTRRKRRSAKTAAVR